jgi:hypothetical protein
VTTLRHEVAEAGLRAELLARQARQAFRAEQIIRRAGFPEPVLYPEDPPGPRKDWPSHLKAIE